MLDGHAAVPEPSLGAHSARLARRRVDALLSAVDRRRAELWIISVLLIMGVTALVALLATRRDVLPQALRLDEFSSWIAAVLIVGVALAFLVYVWEKERNLRQVTRMLVEERVRSTSLQSVIETERESVARLEELDRLKNDFVATISHELRTPLTAIIGAAKTVARKGPTMEAHQHEAFMSVIQRQADRLLRLVQDVLSASRLESSQPRLRRERVGLRVLAEALVEDFAHTELGADRRILLHTDPNDPTTWADEGALAQIFSNLLENALKYSSGDVEITIAETENEATVEVADHGEGMSQEQLTTIFDRFSQVEAAAKSATSGVGLGLFIVKNLVEAHNGHIDVVSERGKGTSFKIYLPKRAMDR